jgi:hypothetical protein
MCPVSVSFAALLRFFCASLFQGEASNAPARPLIRQAFQCGGVQPWTVQRRRGYPARPVRFHEPEENRLSRSPGDFARVSPNHPGTGPTSPATQTGVSVVGRKKYGTGFEGGDLRG